MDLNRELLDHRVIDCNGTIVGRVDGIIMEMIDGEAPRVIAIALGGNTAHGRLGRGAVKLAAVIRRLVGARRPAGARVAWRDIAHFGRDVRLLIPRQRVDTWYWERWLRRNMIERLPGGSSK